MNRVQVAYIAALILPSLFYIVLLLNDVPVAYGDYETGKYSGISFDWMEHGFFNFGKEAVFHVQRLPGYPALLAINFWLFGKDFFPTLIGLQILCAAGTVVFTALSAARLNPNWFWPAVVVAALTLNISYRATLALPDTLFVFLVAGFMWSALGVMEASSRWRYVLWMSVFGAAAILTRPVFQFVVIVALPMFLVALSKGRGLSLARCISVTLVPLSVIVIAYAGQSVKNAYATGHFTYTTQSGAHALYWLMPCLSQKYACGTRNVPALKEAGRRYKEEVSVLAADVRENPVMQDRVRQQLAKDMIREIPTSTLLTSTVGWMAKLMVHTSLYEFYERLGIEVAHISEMDGATPWAKAKTFVQQIFASSQMIVWALFQAIVLVCLVLQVIGALGVFWRSENRWQILFIISLVVALLGPTLGIGNPRYRTPAEPMLVVLLLQGLSLLMTRKKRV